MHGAERIDGWMEERAAYSGQIPTIPVPLVDPPLVTKYQRPAEPTFNLYSTDRPYPEPKSPTIRAKPSTVS